MTARVREILLSNGMVTLVNEEDYDYARRYSWRYTKGGEGKSDYVKTDIRQQTYKLHRLILRARPGEIVDHVNRNTLDNRRCNLRFCDWSQNATNREFINKYGFRGVNSRRDNGKYYAMARKGKTSLYGPTRTDPADAALDYDSLALQLFGEFAILNFTKATTGAVLTATAPAPAVVSPAGAC
jgi:hypothetical protein